MRKPPRHRAWIGLLSAAVTACFYHPVGSVGGSASSSGGPDSTGGDASTGEPPPTSSTGSPPACGDGVVDPGEQCDDGSMNGAYGFCAADCGGPGPRCGDGQQDPEEQCDDGNDVDGDGCDAACTETAVCGDGVVGGGEQCDDGAKNGSYDACAADCSGPGPRCGDGQRNGPEECDDANAVDDDDCSDTCVAPRVVFVTSASFSGDLGGILGADAECEQAATDGLLPPGLTWLAWLSNNVTSPAARFETDYTGYYKLRDGTVVAHGWADLTDGALAHALDVDEKADPVLGPKSAWSATAITGDKAGADHCLGWTVGTGDTEGRYGDATAVTDFWTDISLPEFNPTTCDSLLHLYCFQNSPPP